MTFALFLGTLLVAGVLVAAVRQGLSARKSRTPLELGVGPRSRPIGRAARPRP